MHADFFTKLACFSSYIFENSAPWSIEENWPLELNRTKIQKSKIQD